MGGGSGKELPPSSSAVSRSKKFDSGPVIVKTASVSTNPSMIRVNNLDPFPVNHDVFDVVRTGDLNIFRNMVDTKTATHNINEKCSTTLNYYSSTGENFKESFEQVSMLHISAEKGNLDIVDFLLRKGLSVNSICLNKSRGLKVTPLHLASYNGHLEVVKVLINGGADVNISETEESEEAGGPFMLQSPLHLALRNKQLNIIKQLLNVGANAELKFKQLDNNGNYQLKSSLELAGDSKIEQLIQKAIENNYTDPENSLIFGNGVTGEQKYGIKSEFTIVLRDKFKSYRKKGGENVRVRFEPLEDDVTMKYWPVRISDMNNGTLTVTYTPIQSGNFNVIVTIVDFLLSNNEQVSSSSVAKSPYQVTIVNDDLTQWDEDKDIAIRFHINETISHFKITQRTSLDILTEIVINENGLKPSEPLKYKYQNDTGNWEIISNEEEWKKAKSDYEESGKTRFELHLN